ncbi:MAG TPA: threonine/serine dehydratase [Sphingomonadaceae bacterium]|nr:threonine/serine dehydratase [Sphingomonadaceae bacterium]
MTQSGDLRKPTRDGVLDAARRIAAILPQTPLLPVEINGEQCWVKVESLQPIGAFKIRGAWNRIGRIPEGDRERGVIGVSSGNHAQGVAWAARRLGMPATIVMPEDAPRVKTDNVRALGAEIVTYDRRAGDRDEIARELQEKTGATIVHAFADPWIIEGQGSAGIEAAAQLVERGEAAPTRFIAPCGGGGLSAGLALACPEAEIVPVEPAGWDVIGRSLAEGRELRASPDAPHTICDCLLAPAARQINLDVLKGRAEPCLTVSDAEIRSAMRFAFANLRLVIEPGANAGLAAALAGKARIDRRTVILLTGGNVDPAVFAGIIESAN